MKVAIVGYGNIGQAIESVMADAGGVRCWDKDLDKLPKPISLSEAVAGAEIVYLCVPTKSIRDALTSMRPFLEKNALIVLLSKGIEASTNQFSYQIIEEVLPGQKYALLSGPMLSIELENNKGAAGVVATTEQKAFGKIKDSFNNRLTLGSNRNVKAVALAGVLKNVYSLLAGVAHGLGYEKNIHGYLVSKAVAESQNIAKVLECDPTAMLGVAGLADLVATSSSESSQNRVAGISLSKGDYGVMSEGIYSLDALMHLIQVDQFPLLRSIIAIAKEKADPKVALKELLA